MIFAPPSTGLPNAGQRVIRMPSGIPLSTARAMEAPTSQRCSAVSSRTSVWFCWINCRTFMIDPDRPVSLHLRGQDALGTAGGTPALLLRFIAPPWCGSDFRFEGIYVGCDHGVAGIHEFAGLECDYQLT